MIFLPAAKALGMDGTAVVNPSGIGTANVTTPRDLFQLAKAVRQYRQFLFDMTYDLNAAMMYGPIKFENLHIVNPLSETEGYKGGMVARGETINNVDTQSVLAAYELTVRDTKRNVVIVILNSEHLTDDVKNMITYIKQMYR